jgi:hypothetical protein
MAIAEPPTATAMSGPGVALILDRVPTRLFEMPMHASE